MKKPVTVIYGTPARRIIDQIINGDQGACEFRDESTKRRPAVALYLD